MRLELTVLDFIGDLGLQDQRGGDGGIGLYRRVPIMQNEGMRVVVSVRLLYFIKLQQKYDT